MRKAPGTLSAAVIGLPPTSDNLFRVGKGAGFSSAAERALGRASTGPIRGTGPQRRNDGPKFPPLNRQFSIFKQSPGRSGIPPGRALCGALWRSYEGRSISAWTSSQSFWSRSRISSASLSRRPRSGSSHATSERNHAYLRIPSCRSARRRIAVSNGKRKNTCRTTHCRMAPTRQPRANSLSLSDAATGISLPLLLRLWGCGQGA